MKLWKLGAPALIGFALLFFPISLLAAEAPTAADPGDDLESSVARMAKIRACWSPSFSPDGRRIAFVSDLNGVPQVWVVDSEGGWPDLVTSLDDQVGGVEWSPSGDWLAFSLAPGGGMNQQIYLTRPDGSELRRLTGGGLENNWLGDWSHDGKSLMLASNRRQPQSMDSWVYGVESAEFELLAENPGIGTIADISRDGRRALLWRMESRSSDNLFVRELEDGAEFVLTPHEGPGSARGGRLSPSGSTVYLGTNVGRDLFYFGRVELGEDGKPSPIEVLAARSDAELGFSLLSPDGKTAVLLWNAAGSSELEFVDLETLARTEGPKLPGEIVGGLTFSRDGSKLAMSISGSVLPADIWVLERSSRTLTQVTRSPHAAVDLDSLVSPELRSYSAHDGLELTGWLYRPHGVTEAAPYVLSFHGGPEGQERPSFRSDYQALLLRGIGVFAPNVRGSAGFGKRFVNLDNVELRYDGIRDIEASVDYLVDAGLADPDRLGIMGGSYGGYMTMAGLAWYPDLFAAGANLFGVVNFETFFAHTEPWMAAISTLEYGDPATQAELLRDLSPIHKVDRVKAATIVLHGANDTNVPVVEAEQVVESLKARGVPVEYVLFPDEGHGFSKTANRITSRVAVVKWFEKHLKAE
ncbi:MAG: S9 family peptidase [bacterium]|nr:S9 family peptidase [bacterium]